jgi:hypothetical protein
MKHFVKTDASEVAKAGHSITDIEEGRKAGCGLNIGTTTGADSMYQLESANPVYTFHYRVDILPFLN